MREVIVIGAGFRGFAACLRLLSMKDVKVHLVDSAKKLGGIMYSRQVGEFAVDNGVHMFDSIPQDLAAIIDEIMDGQVREIDFVSESALNNKITKGFSLPDLSALPLEIRQRIALELIELSASEAKNLKPNNLLDLFHLRYAKTAGDIFNSFFRRVYNIDAEELEPTVINNTSLGRLKFLDDPEMLVLKSDKYLDTTLAARRRSVGKIDDFVSIYPQQGGMKEFCDRALKWLKQKGVEVHLGEIIQALNKDGSKHTVKTDSKSIGGDYVIWANDNLEMLAELTKFPQPNKPLRHCASMVLLTFFTQANNIKDFTYLQNFTNEDYTYRSASAGLYSNQISSEGLSFITCECPTAPGTERWDTAEKWVEAAWNECKRLGVVQDSAALESHDMIRVPKTNKLSLVGFNKYVTNLIESVQSEFPKVLVDNTQAFNRREIYFESEKLLEQVK